MAKASHGTSHAVAVLGWLINHVRLKPSEWLMALCAALNPAWGPVRGTSDPHPSAAHNAGPPGSALRVSGAVVPGTASPARRLLLRKAPASACAHALARCVPALSPSASLLARGFYAKRDAVSCPAVADVSRARRQLASRTAVTESGFAVSATSAASVGAETEGEDGAGDVAASGEHALTMQRLCLTALAHPEVATQLT